MANIKNSNLLNSTGIPFNKDACIVLVKTEWNANIVDELEKGCIEQLKKYGVEKIKTITVPGAVEIPFAIKAFWEKNGGSKKKQPSAFIALGCVIKGDTPHFDYVCSSATLGITQLNTTLPVPSIFGILTVNTEEQAIERIGGKHGHKGEEAAATALKMIQIVSEF